MDRRSKGGAHPCGARPVPRDAGDGGPQAYQEARHVEHQARDRLEWPCAFCVRNRQTASRQPLSLRHREFESASPPIPSEAGSPRAVHRLSPPSPESYRQPRSRPYLAPSGGLLAGRISGVEAAPANHPAALFRSLRAGGSPKPTGLRTFSERANRPSRCRQAVFYVRRPSGLVPSRTRTRTPLGSEPNAGANVRALWLTGGWGTCSPVGFPKPATLVPRRRSR